jgi:hypothetical protein
VKEVISKEVNVISANINSLYEAVWGKVLLFGFDGELYALIYIVYMVQKTLQLVSLYIYIYIYLLNCNWALAWWQ